MRFLRLDPVAWTVVVLYASAVTLGVGVFFSDIYSHF